MINEQRMTAKQWSQTYGWDSVAGGVRFWSIIMAVFVAGMLAGGYLVFRNTPTASAAVRSESVQAGADVQQSAGVSNYSAQEDVLQAKVTETVARGVAAGSNWQLVPEQTTLSLPYSIQVQNIDGRMSCVDYLLVELDGEVRIVSLSPVYSC
jgi:hypothetical protein